MRTQLCTACHWRSRIALSSQLALRRAGTRDPTRAPSARTAVAIARPSSDPNRPRASSLLAHRSQDGKQLAGHRAPSIDADSPNQPTIDHGATSLGPQCALATSTATILVTADCRPSRSRNVSGTAREKSRRTICDFFSKNRKRFCGTRKAKGVSSRPHHGACFFGVIHRRADVVKNGPFRRGKIRISRSLQYFRNH
jgi:hypothetical protein